MGQQAGPARPKEFQCDGLSAAGVAAAAGFAEICLQFAETDTVYQSGGRCWVPVLTSPDSPGAEDRWYSSVLPKVLCGHQS